MRTTIDLPPDLHRAASLIARDRRQSLSRTVSDLLRSALVGEIARSTILVRDSLTGLPLISVTGRLTAEDVDRAMQD